MPLFTLHCVSNQNSIVSSIVEWPHQTREERLALEGVEEVKAFARHPVELFIWPDEFD